MRVKIMAAILLMLLPAACSDSEPAKPEASAFQGQTEALDKAREAEKMIGEAAEQQKKALEAQGE